MKGILPVLVTLLLLQSERAFTQNYNMNGAPIADCNGSFFDSGGSSGNYGNNQNFNSTICSDGSGGTHIRLDFSGVELAPGDALCFFDGQNAFSPMLGCSSDYTPGQPFVVQATAANTSGCMTVTFNSNASGSAKGWGAAISCVASCQTLLAELVSTAPAVAPADTGWIDACPGQRIFFTGKGIYPQNGLAYNQSDLTTKFEWNFGDGSIAYGPAVSHVFDKSGGFFVSLTLADAKGCKSTNLVNQRVRVAPAPDFALGEAYPASICAGDTLSLTAAVGTTAKANLRVSPQLGKFALQSTRADSLPLPDGTGVAYQSSLYFTKYAPGATLTNASDLEGICVNMEHSWMRDLEIRLSCPSGKSVVLHDFGGRTGSPIFLGEPNDNDSALDPKPGKGFDYCWTSTATNPKWLTYADQNFTITGGTLPAGAYQSAEPLSQLLGCPLNGQWTLTATDLWQQDNGFVFSWGVDFKQSLQPPVEVFQPALTSWEWKNQPSIFEKTNEKITASPKLGGSTGYKFTVQDAFGCIWDSILNLVVKPLTHPDCFKCGEKFAALQDKVVCKGGSVQLDGLAAGQNSVQVGFENWLDYRFGNANHPPQNQFIQPISVGSLGFSTLTDVLNQIEKVCVDIETDWDSDLDIYLRAPDGKQLELSTGNGGSGDNYHQTCFSPKATNPVAFAAAPFSGTYRPEGNFTNLNGSPAVGEWKLVVSDDAGASKWGKINWWQIHFNAPYNATFDWQNAGSLSCNNCPNPIATPTATTTYVVEATDNFNCSHQQAVKVEVFQAFAAPANLDLVSMQNGQMTFAWAAVPNATAYEVNVNGSGWVPANGNLSHKVTGLASGDEVEIEVRAAGGGSTACQAEISEAQYTYVACTLTATLNSTLPAKCPGTATGSAYLSVNQAVSPVKYYPDGGTFFFNNGGITNYFTAGNHFVVVEDAIGCRDTVFFSITEPPAINLNIATIDATCEGDNDGSAMATASGGLGAPFTFQWQNCSGGTVISGPTANNLYAGCYHVTVTDNNDCEKIDTFQINQPPKFSFSSQQDSVSCYGGSDGSATIFVTGGGQAPFAYLWDNGATTQTANGLDAKFHAVTVTDSKGCQKTTIVQVLQPLTVNIDSVPGTRTTCFNGTDGTAKVFVHGGTPPFKYAWENGSITQTTTGLMGGDIYNVTVTDFNGCSDVSATVVPEPPAIQIQTSSIVPESCAGKCDGRASVAATGGNGGLTFKWSSPSIPPGTQNPTNLCAGTYTLTVTDSKGCSNTTSLTIAAASLMTATIVNAADPKCFGSNDGSVGVSVTGGDAPYTYLWNSLSTNPNLNNIPCGTYTVTVTDEKGCTQTATEKLDCPPALQILPLVATPVKCFGDSNGSLAATVQGGTPPLSYLWNDPNNQTNATATNLSANTYAVQVTDANGCKTSGTGTVTTPNALLATVTPLDVNCFGESTGSVTANPTGGTSPYSYLWTSGQTTQTVSNLPAGTYNLTVTDKNGCVYGQASVQVNQPGSAVAATALQTDTSCFGYNEGDITASAVGGNGAPYSFKWSNNGSTPKLSDVPTGTYSVTATDQKGCTGTATVEVSEYLEITANIATAKPTCYGMSDGSATINNVSGGSGGGNPNAYKYNWSEPNPPNATFISNLTGGLTYAVTITDTRGCEEEYSFTLEQPKQIQIEISQKSVSCNGLTDGSATVTNVLGDNPVASYAWSNGGSTGSLTDLPAGTYFVTVTDTKGCTEASLVEVLEPDELKITGFKIDGIKCQGDSLGSVTANVIGGTPGYLFSWENGATTAKVDKLKAGIYPLTVTDASGCTAAGSAEIAQPGAANFTLAIENVDCFGDDDGRVRVIPDGTAPPYKYSLDGKNFTGSSTFYGLAAGDYTFFIKDGNGCNSAISGSVTQPDELEIGLTPDTTITLGDSILIQTDVRNAVGVTSFEWRPGHVEDLQCMDTVNCQAIEVKPVYTNVYRVIVTDENGCRAEASTRVQVSKYRGVYVPSGFTPNDDLENDILNVFGKSRMIQEVTMFRVFDRWGEMVFQDEHFPINDTTRGWNGEFRGKRCDPGQFAWFVEVLYIDGYRETYQGNTQLIR